MDGYCALSRKRKHCCVVAMGILGLIGMPALATAQGASPKPEQTTPARKFSTNLQNPRATAWRILREGLRDKTAEKRAQAVRALGLLPADAEAAKTASAALKDDSPNVRQAAASALGAMHARSARKALEDALDDSEPSVALAAADALLILKDRAAYDVYYTVLTGERRAANGLIREQVATLRDKKKMAQFGFEEGLGFIPFAGIGYEVFKVVTKDDSSPVRALAAKKLAHDPDPEVGEALATATKDKSFLVRAAALAAIAQRGDRSLLPKITGELADEKDVVRFVAAACVVHLTDLPVNHVRRSR